MKQTVIVLVGAFLSLLCLAALDDITTTNEPDLVAEYAMVAVTLLWWVIVGVAIRSWRRTEIR